jgi:hypothetical protein
MKPYRCPKETLNDTLKILKEIPARSKNHATLEVEVPKI